MRSARVLVTVDRHCKNKAVLLKRETPAERVFHDHLARLGIVYKRQQGFYWPFYRIADFYLPTLNLIVEIDGGYHAGIKEQDARKDAAFLAARGIRTLRLTNEAVLSGQIPPIA